VPIIMSRSSDTVEQAIDQLCARFPVFARQEIVLARLLCQIAVQLSGELNQLLGSFGIGSAGWSTLLVLYGQAGHALCPSDVSEALGFSRTHATRIADEMVEKGWIRRVPCADDRRKVKLKLEPAGLALVLSTTPRAFIRVAKLWRDCSSLEIAVLESLMRKVSLQQVSS